MSDKINGINQDVLSCPVCGEYEFEYFGDICPVCGWEHTPTGLIDPDEIDGANHSSLNDFKINFVNKRLLNSKYRWEEETNKKIK